MKTNKLKIVLDTNVLLVSISPHSQYHWIVFSSLINGIAMNYKKKPKEEIKTTYTYNFGYAQI